RSSSSAPDPGRWAEKRSRSAFFGPSTVGCAGSAAVDRVFDLLAAFLELLGEEAFFGQGLGQFEVRGDALPAAHRLAAELAGDDLHRFGAGGPAFDGDRLDRDVLRL